MEKESDATPGSDVRMRQFAILAACVVGLVVAAFAMPATAPTPSPSEHDHSRSPPDCRIQLTDNPVPGQPVTAIVLYDGSAATEVSVWFNGKFVGRTDDAGRVTGVVPYQRTLSISVVLPGGGECQAGTATGEAGSTIEAGSSAGLGFSTSERGSRAGVGSLARPAVWGPTPSASPAGSLDAGNSWTERVTADDRAQQAPQSNRTGEYVVDGRINVTVDEPPVPGGEATISARIGNHSVPEARVTVDGTFAGKTDAAGRLTITAPEEGGATMRVRVTRGEFETVERIPVRRLAVRIQANGPLAVPGSRATVVATLGTEPAANASVWLDGRSIGETDDDGQIAVQLPADPTAQVSVAAAGQTQTQSVWIAFLTSAGLALVVLVVSVAIPAVGYAYDGWAGCKRATKLLVVILFNAAAYYMGDATGLLAMMAALLVVAGIVRLITSDRTLSASAASAGHATESVGQAVVGRLLWLADALAASTDHVRRWIGAVSASVAPLSLSAIGVWVRTFPRRLLGTVESLVRLPWTLLSRLRGGPDDELGSPEQLASERFATRSRSRRAQFRDLWRRFASEVVPKAWPNRTAGEISRRAVDQGLPAEPVQELTDVFRVVEYGDDTLSEARLERARAAFDALTDDDAGEGGES